MPSFSDILRAMRPHQWSKNAVVAAAFFFAFWDRQRARALTTDDMLMVIPAVALFCLVSSAVYIFNDLRDIEQDRYHPVKQNRPIAAGRISRVFAIVQACLLLVTGLGGSWMLSPLFAGVVTSYVALQIIYTLWLKRVALLDVMMIAAGFVMRAIAGAVIFPDVSISPWLLLCTFLLALFLGLCKRRHEKTLTSDNAQRHSLDAYDVRLLDQLIAVTSSSTVVCYAIYTQWEKTVEKFGTHALGFTVPFVIFGIFRYLDLVYRHGKGERPERILLTDVPLLVDLALYAVAVVVVLRCHWTP